MGVIKNPPRYVVHVRFAKANSHTYKRLDAAMLKIECFGHVEIDQKKFRLPKGLYYHFGGKTEELFDEAMDATYTFRNVQSLMVFFYESFNSFGLREIYDAD